MNNNKEMLQSGHRIRVMHVLKSSIYSGAENVVFTIMQGLKDEVDFLYVATEGIIRNKLEQEQLNFRLVPVFNRTELSKVIKLYQPDIIHAHDFSATVLCAAIQGRFRLISHLHYDPPWVKDWNSKTLLYALCYPRIARLIVVSENTCSNMVFAGLYRNKKQIFANPIDEKRIHRRAEAAVPEIKHDSCDLIFVGRLVEQKNPQRFIQLVDQMRKKGHPDIRAWMLGDGELREACEELIQQRNLSEQITMYGFCENPYPYIKRSRILCMTSRWEGFGLVVIEANTLGVPVLSTPTSGCTAVLGENAEELCETDEEFVAGMERLLGNDGEYTVAREAAVAHAMTYDNITSYMHAMLYTYYEIENV